MADHTALTQKVGNQTLAPRPVAVCARLRWRDLYREAELYKAAVRIYTKPLFAWRKALFASTDKKDLYDFARSGLHNLAAIHHALREEAFSFRPAVALHRNFRGKRRTPPNREPRAQASRI